MLAIEYSLRTAQRQFFFCFVTINLSFVIIFLNNNKKFPQAERGLNELLLFSVCAAKV